MASNTVTPPTEWTTDQVLPPEALVDYYVLNSTLTEGEPISVASATKPTEAKKAAPALDLRGAKDLMKLSVPALKEFAKTNGINISALDKDLQGDDKQLLAEFIAANMNLMGG